MANREAEILEAGRLDRKVWLQKDVGTAKDSSNKRIPNWQNVGTLPRSVAIDEKGGKKLFFAQQVQGDWTHVLTLRYYPGLTTANRWLYKDPNQANRIFQIVAVVDVNEAHVKHLCFCKETGATVAT